MRIPIFRTFVILAVPFVSCATPEQEKKMDLTPTQIAAVKYFLSLGGKVHVSSEAPAPLRKAIEKDAMVMFCVDLSKTKVTDDDLIKLKELPLFGWLVNCFTRSGTN